MATLNIALHAQQQRVYDSLARFKVVAAGRRAGKTYFAAIMLIMEALRDRSPSGYNMVNAHVWYVAPTYQQARDVMWKQLKELVRPVARDIKEKDMTVIMPNGRYIVLKGADNENSLRGAKLSYCVLDEYADMKPGVFDIIIRPALSDMEGGALFIGTPKGKNHFYHLYQAANDPKHADMEAFTFTSLDNPMIPPKEIEAAKRLMSREAFRQEFEANFSSGGGAVFKENEFKFVDEIPEGVTGTTYIAVDPAGFKEVGGMSKSAEEALDETAIAVVLVSDQGWYVRSMQHGRWSVRETSLRIIRAAQQYRPAALGIEGGSLKNAIMPYLKDQMSRLNIYPNVVELRHGGQKKTDRIIWALQGRFQNGRITFVNGTGIPRLVDQLLDFPDPLSHDDLPDALAYIDQVASAVYSTHDIETDDWSPIDDVAGY